jgi:hypothetical protein
MIEQLFGSKTRVKLLQLFYSNPNRSYFVREITRKIDEQINSVRRELSNLLSIGIITSETTNNKLYYEVNQKFEYYEPLQQIFGGGLKKSAKKGGAGSGAGAVGAGIANPSVDQTDSAADLRAVGHIDLAVYTGQFTRDESTGVDFLIIGEVNPNALQKYVDDLERAEGKSIRYTVMSLPDFQYRQAINDRFAVGIMNAKKQVLVDLHNLLSEIAPELEAAQTAAETSAVSAAKAAKLTNPTKGV